MKAIYKHKSQQFGKTVHLKLIMSWIVCYFLHHWILPHTVNQLHEVRCIISSRPEIAGGRSELSCFLSAQTRARGNQLEGVTPAWLPCENIDWSSRERCTATNVLELAFNKAENLNSNKAERKHSLSNSNPLTSRYQQAEKKQWYKLERLLHAFSRNSTSRSAICQGLKTVLLIKILHKIYFLSFFFFLNIAIIHIFLPFCNLKPKHTWAISGSWRSISCSRCQSQVVMPGRASISLWGDCD